MKTARILRAFHNPRINRHQFLVEFSPPIDVSETLHDGAVTLLPRRAGRRQLVRYALVSAVDQATAAFEVRSPSYELGEPWGDLFAEAPAGVSPARFLADMGYLVEDPRGLLKLGSKGGALKTAGLALAGLVVLGGIVAVATKND